MYYTVQHLNCVQYTTYIVYITQLTPCTFHIHCHRSLNIQPYIPQYIQFQERRSYAVNCACTYFLRCSEERNSFTEDIRQRNSNARNLNHITINLVRNYTIYTIFLHDLKIYLLYRNNNNYKNKDILLPSEVY